MADRQEEEATEGREGSDGEQPFRRERSSRMRTKIVAPIKAAVALKVAGDDSVSRVDVHEDGAGEREREARDREQRTG